MVTFYVSRFAPLRIPRRAAPAVHLLRFAFALGFLALPVAAIPDKGDPDADLVEHPERLAARAFACGAVEGGDDAFAPLVIDREDIDQLPGMLSRR